MIRRRSALRTAAAVLVAGLLVSCGSEPPSGPDPDEIVSVSVTPSGPQLLDLGETLQLSAVATTRAGDPDPSVVITWSATPAGVVDVGPDGLVEGLTEGAARVTASAAGVTSTGVGFTVVDLSPPSAPSTVEAEPFSHTQADVTWADNSNNEDEFRIEREEVGGAPSSGGAAQTFSTVGTVGAGVTSFRDGGLQPNSSYRYLVRACNENGCTPESGGSGEAEATSEVMTTHEILEITTTSLPTGVEGQSYQAAVETAGGAPEKTFTVVSGQLPAGLVLDESTGVISGTPTAPPGRPGVESSAGNERAGEGPFDVGLSNFTVQVSGTGGQTAQMALSITIFAELRITTADLADAPLDVPYSETVAAAGGDSNFTFSLASGQLPPGLTLNPASGVISGTPTVSGIFNFVGQVTSGDGQVATRALSIDVVAVVTITTTSLPDGTIDVFYSRTLAAVGGNGTFTWSLATGSDPLPPGLSLASDGTISGVPTETGTFTPTVQAESGGESDTRLLSLTINLPPVSLDTDYLVGGNEGVPYADDLDASGGDESFVFTVIEGEMPSGLDLDPNTGEITGVPDGGSAGAYYFTVEVESAGDTDSKTFAVAISTNAPGGFNMWIMNVAPDGTALPSASVLSAMSDALARWEAIITGDLADVTYAEDRWSSTALNGQAQRLNGQTIDDVLVLMSVEPRDGPGGVLASALTFDARATGGSLNAIFGRVRYDEADLGRLDAVQLFSVVFHEIGHVVGIGTLWPSAGLISGRGGPDPRFEGGGGNAVFRDELGGGSAGAMKIPIEADFGGGTRDGHWDEGEFDTEVMTGFSERAGVAQPISKMTIAAMGDLAYTVDTSVADPYSIPGCAPSCVPGPPPSQVAGGTLGERLMDDIEWGPIHVSTPDGRPLGVIRVRPDAGGAR